MIIDTCFSCHREFEFIPGHSHCAWDPVNGMWMPICDDCSNYRD